MLSRFRKIQVSIFSTAVLAFLFSVTSWADTEITGEYRAILDAEQKLISRDLDTSRIMSPGDNRQDPLYSPETGAVFALKTYWVPTDSSHSFFAKNVSTRVHKMMTKVIRGKNYVRMIVHPESEQFFREFLKNSMAVRDVDFMMSRADVQIPVIASDLADVACEIRIVTKDLITQEVQDKPHGSGTFIKENLFLTAAHVVTGFYPPFLNVEFLKTYIACPGSRNIQVKSWIIHPQFFNPGVFDSSHQVDYPAKLEGPNSFPANDMAVLITEPVVVKNIKVTFDADLLKKQIESKTCRLLGYSPSICDDQTGVRCARSVDLSIRKISTGFLSVNDISDLSGGDSGVGLICGSQQERYLVGIYRSRTQYQEALGLSEKRTFLEPMLSMNEEALLRKAAEIQFSTKYLSAAYALAKTQLAIHSITKNRIQLNSLISVSETQKTTQLLQAFIGKNPQALKTWADQKIQYINIVTVSSHQQFEIQGSFLSIDPLISDESLHQIRP